ncbi:beta-galactosidase [Micromonospora sp. 4G57]|uniref:Beta-galactosidase n=1 Tax=Micromonospora sicca TaxID=2202420 RepID=A0ABU5JKJ1_9ACTN|nr:MULTISPECIES: beta-galactosidase [unclassified Micromonospora]MDZ5447352.1 beta-galactosidase [Micromonospora sp. 4G57]MDZ5493086.1 beta-galactosidase [Micromonospora sp. 4G53]
MRSWHGDGIWYGADYNPEQWPEQTWLEDVALMRRAGVNLVSVGIFSWALLEPAPGEFDFGWLDRALDVLHDGGIRVDLATATASPPPWLAHRHPETLPRRADGAILWPGGRQAYCPSSPVFRERSLALVEAVAGRYAAHPAVVMWHVSNELGCHNVHCYCDVSAEAFRRWLRDRYGDLASLNAAWGTAFWSQRYHDWAEINPPRTAPTFANPTQQLDFLRFSSDEQRAQLRAERELLTRLAPQPVTTNFMIGTGVKYLDYHSWAADVDVVANDHYLVAADPQPQVNLALAADHTRGVAGGDPWLLMEHSTSAVNWQPRNVAKTPGQLRRNSLAHVARGADGVLFFQWRASRAGAEKFHSALVPHAGPETKVFREVCRLGADLKALAEVRGSRVDADVAILFDYEAWWGAELDSHPSVDVTYVDRLAALHGALWRAGVTADVVHPSADLSRYRLVLAPTLYLVRDADAEALRRYVEAGGTALVTYFSGIVDEHDHIRLGGYPGAFRELLGLRTEEFFPLREGEQVTLDDGATADVWTEWLHPEGAEVLASYTDGPLPGVAALTRHTVGAGAAWYVGTRLDEADTDRLVARLLTESGARPPVAAPPGVEVVRRRDADRSWLFVINHTDADARLAVTGAELLGGGRCDGELVVSAGDVAVVREVSERAAEQQAPSGAQPGDPVLGRTVEAA